MYTSRLALAIMLAIPATFVRPVHADGRVDMVRALMVTGAFDSVEDLHAAGDLTTGLQSADVPAAAKPAGVATKVSAAASPVLHGTSSPDSGALANVSAAARAERPKTTLVKTAARSGRSAPKHGEPAHKTSTLTDAQTIERLRKQLAARDAEIAALRAELKSSRAVATVQLVPVATPARPVEPEPVKEAPTVVILSGSQLNREALRAMSTGAYQEAVEKFRRAADLNDSAAMANLGTMYLNGTGVPQNTQQALTLLARAANNGNRTAAENLGTLCEYGISGVAQNPLRAYQWYDVAARLGSTTVQTAMSRIKAMDD